MDKLQNELDEEKEMNKCLVNNQKIYQTKLTNLEEDLKAINEKKAKEIKELQDQLKDVMFFLDSKMKLSDNAAVSSEELKSSQIIVSESIPTTSRASNNPETNAKQSSSNKKK